MRTILTTLTLLVLTFAGPVTAQTGPSNESTRVAAVLSTYKTALERLDLDGVDKLFADRNEVIESGKVEGGYADYLANHIGPELGHFDSFKFSDYKVNVRIEGRFAWATETYRYTIRLKDKAKPEPIERQGVATSVLKKIGSDWKIVSMHSSTRTPKPAKKI